MEAKGYYNDYAYMGLVDGTYMPFANEADYHQYLNGEKPTKAVLKARKEQMKKTKKHAMTYFNSEAKGSGDPMVSHPPHYQSSSGLEVLTVIKAFTEDLYGIEAVDTAQVLKYVCRWKKKNGKQDLEKARFYLDDLINYLESLEKED